MPNRIRIVVFAIVSALLIAPQPAWSWGGDGHRTVGMIADVLLQQHPATRERINQILGGASLSDASVWADCAKGFRYCHREPTAEEKAYTQRNPNHHDYHYSDVPIQQNAYRPGTAGTKPYDVVQIIRYSIQVLRGQRPNDSPSGANLTEKEALWVLTHIVGDIHQPLHVGAVYFDHECANVVDPNIVGAGKPNFGIGTIVVDTTGGNDLMISQSKSLHAYWDDSAVLGAMRLDGVRNKSIADFVTALMRRPPTGWETQGDLDTWPTQWATEIMPLANQAITDVEIGEGTPSQGDRGPKCTWPVTLERDYTGFANQRAHAQLAKAGYRLAALLVAIFESH